MRFSAISSRVKSWVSSSTLGGSLVVVEGRGAAADDGINGVDELHRKTLPKDCQNVEDVFGIEAILSDAASSLSTAAFTRYAIAAGLVYRDLRMGSTHGL